MAAVGAFSFVFDELGGIAARGLILHRAICRGTTSLFLSMRFPGKFRKPCSDPYACLWVKFAPSMLFLVDKFGAAVEAAVAVCLEV